ncbi:M48 family metalloprotease [Vibrio parahaemolyticus]|uniref:Peptidase M48 domain-containing protein n=4 Tax=Vibrio parahaemolyticus TaxID=670 RepID=A0AAW8QE34_VIBPH|nr:M48 family metalloprotease [Vibrio parahaemolyticus]MBE3701168.1 hypothetical protein [Vibrio parahaemolyticus]MBE3780411.1 hypothetical protein [Vibrio parahaemolyticus]MCZ5870621.1 hypothetical protein [Vibrio parahaemolyticus]MCZ5901085.1 hypothetical protein [Vibrio parahaemolyticus]MCZ6023652.1 hypothetical protein [Vibrio parahaemolyticus]
MENVDFSAFLEDENVEKAKQGVVINTGNGIMHLFGAVNNSDYLGLGDDALFFAPFCSRDDVEKIMNPKSASDYLLKLRAESIVDNPRLIRVFLKRKAGYTNWSLSEYYKKQDRDPLYLKFLSKGNYDKLKNVPAGSAYINTVNAVCSKSPKGNVIAVSEPLEQYLYFMNIFFYGDDFGIDDHNRFNAFLIAQRLIAGFESPDFDLDPRCIFPESVEIFMSGLTNIQYQFILGHEYSHHLLGHLSDANLVSTNFSEIVRGFEGTYKLSHYKYSHKLEYDADWHAIKFIKGNKQFRNDVANGAFLALMYMKVSSMVLDYINPARSTLMSTHPDPIQRIWKLRTRLNNKLGFDRDQLTNNISFLESYTNDFLNHFVAFNFDDFEKYGSVYLPSYKKKLLIDRLDF